jgi:hypothetical protein
VLVVVRLAVEHLEEIQGLSQSLGVCEGPGVPGEAKESERLGSDVLSVVNEPPLAVGEPVVATPPVIPQALPSKGKGMGGDIAIHRLGALSIGGREKPNDAHVRDRGLCTWRQRTATTIEPPVHAAVLPVDGMLDPEANDALVELLSEPLFPG